jgi:hypothetical protein
VTTKRNGPLDERPVPRTVETVKDDLSAHDTGTYSMWHPADQYENRARGSR